MRSSTVWIACGFVFLWNSGFVGALYGLPDAGPLTLLVWRYLGLSALLIGVVAASGAWPRGTAAISQSAVVGILAHGGWLGCVLIALDLGVPASLVALVTALQPLTTGALSGLVTGEHTTLRQWLGLTIGFLGVVIAVGFRIHLDPGVPWPAYLVPFGSVVTITAASLIQRRATIRNLNTLPVMTDMLVQCLATAAALLPLAIVFEGLETQWTFRFAAALAWLTLPVSLGGYGLMWVLLGRRDATWVASLFYLSPPVTMIMMLVVFGEIPVLTDLLGMVVVALGVALVTLNSATSQVLPEHPE